MTQIAIMAVSNKLSRVQVAFWIVTLFALVAAIHSVQGKDFKIKENPQKGNTCIARFDSTTGEPLYYNCPRPNESEKKSYCCYLDKCCDYKEFQKQTEKQYKMTQVLNQGYIAKGAIGSALKFLLWVVFIIILIIVGCCCLVFFMCRKKRLFQGGVFNSPLPTQPPGPSPYAPPTNPYMAYQWPPETASGPAAAGPAPPPAYPQPSYPPYPTPGGPTRMAQPPFNPNYK